MMKRAIGAGLAIALLVSLALPQVMKGLKDSPEPEVASSKAEEPAMPVASSAPETSSAEPVFVFLDDAGKAAPIGLIFRGEDGLYEGVFRWATIVDDNGFYLRFPESSMRLGLGREGPEAFWVYCLGNYKNDGMSMPRSNPSTECKSLNLEERNAAYDRFRPKKVPGLAVPTLGSVKYDGHNGEYYDIARFSNGHGILVETENPRVFLADMTMLTQSVQDKNLNARTDDLLFVLVPVDEKTAQGPLLNRGTVEQGCYQAFDQIEAFYAELSKPRYWVRTRSEFGESGLLHDKVNVILRHDLDLSIYGARQLAALEQSFGLRSTYHVNFASGFSGLVAPRGRYVMNPTLEENLRSIQAMGHTIGFQNDLMFFNLFYDIEAKAWAHQYLDRLRAAGFEFISNTNNGSPYYGETGIDNLFTFSEYRLGGKYWWEGYKDRNGANGHVTYKRDGAEREVDLPELSKSDIGIIYDSATLSHEYKDTDFKVTTISDVGVSRDEFLTKLRTLEQNTLVEILIHPVDWTMCNFDGDIFLEMKLREKRSEQFGRLRWPKLGELQ